MGSASGGGIRRSSTSSTTRCHRSTSVAAAQSTSVGRLALLWRLASPTPVPTSTIVSSNSVFPSGVFFKWSCFRKLARQCIWALSIRHQITDHDGIVAVVREAVVARYELAAIEGKDFPEPMEEERHHAGLAAFEG